MCLEIASRRVATGSDKTLATLGAGSLENTSPLLYHLLMTLASEYNKHIMERIALCAGIMSREVIRVWSSHTLLLPTNYP
jgi:hypothetical protein